MRQFSSSILQAAYDYLHANFSKEVVIKLFGIPFPVTVNVDKDMLLPTNHVEDYISKKIIPFNSRIKKAIAKYYAVIEEENGGDYKKSFTNHLNTWSKFTPSSVYVDTNTIQIDGTAPWANIEEDATIAIIDGSVYIGINGSRYIVEDFTDKNFSNLFLNPYHYGEEIAEEGRSYIVIINNFIRDPNVPQLSLGLALKGYKDKIKDMIEKNKLGAYKTKEDLEDVLRAVIAYEQRHKNQNK